MKRVFVRRTVSAAGAVVVALLTSPADAETANQRLEMDKRDLAIVKCMVKGEAECELAPRPPLVQESLPPVLESAVSYEPKLFAPTLRGPLPADVFLQHRIPELATGKSAW